MAIKDDTTFLGSFGVALQLNLHPNISTALIRPRRPKQYCLQVNPSSVLVLSPIRDVKRIIAFFFCSFKKKACENPGLYRIRTLDLFNPFTANVAKGKFRPNFHISLSKLLTNKQYHVKVQAESFHLNGHIIGFRLQTQKLESPYKTPSSTLAVKGSGAVIQPTEPTS